MNSIDVTKRGIGVNFTGAAADAVVWAPLAETVALKLVRTGKAVPLERDAWGYWCATGLPLSPGDLYTIVLDEQKELPEPASLSQPQGGHGPSGAIDLQAFRWTDWDWQNHTIEHYLLYELHTGTFTGEGTFSALEEKLDYLKDLGVTAIELMPVAQFPGNRNWGYDGTFPFAVQHSYGGAEELQRLVNACHAQGLAVVLDVVYNHLGPEGNYLGEYGPYFTTKYKTPWGPALNFDDSWCDGVRRYFIENALMWFRDFHVDALRLDAVHAIKDFSPVHILQEIKQYTNQLMEHTGRTHYLIVESDLNDNRYIKPMNNCGYGMDAQWIDEFHHALRVAAGGERHGYYSDFNGVGHLAKAYRDAYVYDGQWSPYRKKKFGVQASDNQGKQFVVFSQNHDQVGNRMLGERSSQLVSFEMQKLLAGAVLVSPYLPMLFMGEEWGEPHPFLYFVSHTDPELAEAVRKGRREEFAAFHGEGEAPDPMAEETFLRSKLQWHLVEKEPHKTLLNYYKNLIALRRKHPALSVLDRKAVEVEVNEEKEVLVLIRTHGAHHVCCMMNFSKELQEVSLPEAVPVWHRLQDSAHPQWGGPVAAPEKVPGDGKVVVQPEAILVYSSTTPLT